MKKFKLEIFIGKFIIYESIFILKKADFDRTLNLISNKGGGAIEDFFEGVFKNFLKAKKISKKEFDKIDEIKLEEILEKYPDVAICAYLESEVMMSGIFSSLENYEGTSLDSFQNEKSIKNLLGECGSKCMLVD